MNRPMLALVTLCSTGCLVDRALYEQRRAELAEQDRRGDDAAVDADGDGVSVDEDCDDTAPDIHPGADETPYDGVDQDCDGADLTDVDGDGVDGEAVGGDDCDDEDATVRPGAAEAWLDFGVDNDCDGQSRETEPLPATDIPTRVDGLVAGGEFGRRMGAWAEGGCLLVAAPYEEDFSGAVYAVTFPEPGVRDTTGAGRISGSGGGALGSVVSAEPGGLALLGEVTADGGAGRASLLSLEDACAGGDLAVASDALVRIEGPSPDAWMASDGDWLGDLDGDGLSDLYLSAPGDRAGGADAGSIAVWLGGTELSGVLSHLDADVVLAGPSGSRVERAVAVEGAGGLPELLVAGFAPAPGDAVLTRFTARELLDEGTWDAAVGGLISYSTDAPGRVARIGDTDRDGEEDFVAGVHVFRLWNPSDLEGAVEVTASPTLLAWRDTDEWLTGVEPVGDLDGDGLAELVVRAEDSPGFSERGLVGLLTADALQPGATNAFEDLGLRAEGTEDGDSFGYRTLPAVDLDGDGTLDIPVAAYGTDFHGASSGSVYLVPSPF